MTADSRDASVCPQRDQLHQQPDAAAKNSQNNVSIQRQTTALEQPGIELKMETDVTI